MEKQNGFAKQVISELKGAAGKIDETESILSITPVYFLNIGESTTIPNLDLELSDLEQSLEEHYYFSPRKGSVLALNVLYDYPTRSLLFRDDRGGIWMDLFAPIKQRFLSTHDDNLLLAIQLSDTNALKQDQQAWTNMLKVLNTVRESCLEIILGPGNNLELLKQCWGLECFSRTITIPEPSNAQNEEMLVQKLQQENIACAVVDGANHEFLSGRGWNDNEAVSRICQNLSWKISSGEIDNSPAAISEYLQSDEVRNYFNKPEKRANAEKHIGFLADI